MRHVKISRILLVLISIAFLLPILLTVTSSLMTPGEVLRRFGQIPAGAGQKTGVTLIPDLVSLKQYYSLIVENQQYFRQFWTSMLYSLVITLFSNIIAIPTAFVLAKYPTRKNRILFSVYILTMMMPFTITMLPNYIMLSRFSLIGKIWAVILPMSFAPFAVFILRQFMLSTQNEQVQAAMLETNSYFQLIFKIIIPANKNGLIAMNILVFAECWNMVELPQLFLANGQAMPLSVSLNGLIEQDASVAFAGSVLYLLPMFLLCLFFHREIADGLEKYKW